MIKTRLRKSLSHPGLLQAVRKEFAAIPDHRPMGTISLVDHLMSCLAIFSLKYPSLLQFDNGRHDAVVRHNLQTLYGIEQAPCDTYLRERLDDIDPIRYLRKSFTKAFHLLQRGKGLEGFTFLDGHYLLSIDGTVFRFAYHGLMKNRHGMSCWMETLLKDCGVDVTGVIFETGFRKRDFMTDGGDPWQGPSN